MARFHAALLVALASVACRSAAADDAAVATLLSGLKQPSAIALRPEGEGTDREIYVCEAGAGRVVRLDAARRGSAEVVIGGFARAGNKAESSDGPRGLAFLDRSRLVVAGGAAGKAFVRLYELPDDAAALRADDFEQQLEIRAEGQAADGSAQWLGCIARTRANESVADAVLIASPEAGVGPRLWRAAVRAGTLGGLEPFGQPDSAADGARAVSVAVGQHGYVVVAERDAKTDANRLTFYNPITRRAVLQMPVDSPPIVGLAYSDRSGQLFAAVAGDGIERDGVYRLDDAGEPGKAGCEAALIARIARPTALAADGDGMLYVTALGNAGENAPPAGVLLQLEGKH